MCVFSPHEEGNSLRDHFKMQKGVFFFAATVAVTVAAASFNRPPRYLRATKEQSNGPIRRFPYYRIAKESFIDETAILIKNSSEDTKGHQLKHIVSIDQPQKDDACADTSCQVELINHFGTAVVFCWVASDGSLHHYYSVDGGSIKDGSVRVEHLEYTHIHHSFVW